jgi:hypothetical protein
MNIRKFLLTAAAAAVLTGAGMALAAPYDHHGPGHHDFDHHDFDHHGGWHDPYWWSGYHHGYIGRDRVFFGLRSHHYTRFIGDPYWYRGHYVVRTYDRWGNLVFVEVNPYTGNFIGEIRF